MTESYINWRRREHLRAVVIPDKEQYYTDLLNIEHSWTGRMDGNICNTFILEAEQQLVNAIELFEEGYFDCAYYSLRSAVDISTTIPLGHLGTIDSMYSPQRFMEQIMAFEYLFDKLDHKRAQNSKFPLKNELECMLDEFPQLLSNSQMSPEKASEHIKELRRTIAHGYSYYYDFKNDHKSQYLIHLLDNLIKKMSLKWIGFSAEDIQNYIM